MIMKLKKLFEKFWWFFPLVAFVFILFIMPLLNLDLFSTYVGVEGKGRITDAKVCERFEGVCYDGAKGIRKSIADDLKGNYLIDECSIKDGICKCTDHLLKEGEACDKYAYEVDLAGATYQEIFVGDGEPEPSEPTAKKTLVCKGDGFLYENGKIHDECDDNGCTYTKGVAVCKGGDSIMDKLEGDVKGVPIWILVLGGLFVTMMFAVRRS